jgi:deoxyribonuclease V
MTHWPTRREELEELQRALAVRARSEAPWRPPIIDEPLRVGAVFAAGPRGLDGPGAAGDLAAVAAVVLVSGRTVESLVLDRLFDAPYARGLLALRDGRALEEAVRRLRRRPDVLLVNATGSDHPRRAGLALHLGAACGLPTVGVTDRPLIATGPDPGPERGAAAALALEGALTGHRLRTRAGARPVVVHDGWRVDPGTAVAVVLGVTPRGRTPEPMREARRLARLRRSEASGPRRAAALEAASRRGDEAPPGPAPTTGGRR